MRARGIPIPIDEDIFRFIDHTTPTVKDMCLRLVDQVGGDTHRDEHIVEAIAIGCEHVWQLIHGLVGFGFRLILRWFHLDDSRVVHQWVRHSLKGVMPESTDIIAIGYIVLHTDIHKLHSCCSGKLHKHRIDLFENLCTVDDPWNLFSPCQRSHFVTTRARQEHRIGD